MLAHISYLSLRAQRMLVSSVLYLLGGILTQSASALMLEHGKCTGVKQYQFDHPGQKGYGNSYSAGGTREVVDKTSAWSNGGFSYTPGDYDGDLRASIHFKPDGKNMRIHLHVVNGYYNAAKVQIAVFDGPKPNDTPRYLFSIQAEANNDEVTKCILADPAVIGAGSVTVQAFEPE